MKKGTSQKNKELPEIADEDDPEELQALDENNQDWVCLWKKTVKKKQVKAQSHNK